MKETIQVIPINAQQGLFLDDHNNIVAAYSHNRKTIYMHTHCPAENIEIPESYLDYAVMERFTDCFSIAYWDRKTDTTRLMP